MKSLFRLGMPLGGRFSLALFVAVLQGLSAVALLVTSAWLIARAAEQPSMMYLSLAVVGVRTFALARAAFRYAERWLSHDAVLGSQSELRPKLFSKIATLVPGTTKLNLGEVSSRIIADVDELPNFSLRVFLPLFQSVVVSILSVIFFAFLLPSAAVVVAVLLILAFVLALPISAAISKCADLRFATDRAELSALLHSMTESAPVLVAYDWQSHAQQRLQLVQRKIAEANLASAKAFGAGQALFSFGAQVSAICAAVLGLQQLQQQHSASFVLLAVYALFPLGIFDVASTATPVVSAWRKYKSAAHRVFDLLGDDSKISGQVGQMAEDLKNQPVQLETLELRDVTLGYDTELLSKVNIKLRAGLVTALTGESGSGKTAIGLAFAGLISPTKGSLLVTSAPFDFASSLAPRVGYLEQSPSILAGNVRQNLLLAKPAATDDELTAVLRKVQLWSMFEARQGLETELGQRGVLISGGEAQRMSLARALLADFAVIILDEPSANLSVSQAKLLVGDLIAEAKTSGRAILLITHQPELSRLADEVYAIE